jgi:hypothetical protein
MSLYESINWMPETLAINHFLIKSFTQPIGSHELDKSMLIRIIERKGRANIDWDFVLKKYLRLMKAE